MVGVPDPRFGEQVAAVVQLGAGQVGAGARGGPGPLPARIWPATRSPARLFVVDQVPRSPSGKPDYPWAKQVATADTTATSSVLSEGS